MIKVYLCVSFIPNNMPLVGINTYKIKINYRMPHSQ